jgi:hypothetical protein
MLIKGLIAIVFYIVPDVRTGIVPLDEVMGKRSKRCMQPGQSREEEEEEESMN